MSYEYRIYQNARYTKNKPFTIKRYQVQVFLTFVYLIIVGIEDTY